MNAKATLVLGMFTLLSFGVFAQNSDKKFGFEISGGAAFPVKEIGHSKLNPGAGFEGVLHYRFMPHPGGLCRLGMEQTFSR
jgi:hypothetical protein